MNTRQELEHKLMSFLSQGKPFSNPLTREELDRAYSLGMLKKSDLEDGKYYYGQCRNASVAQWNATKQQFTYMRTKFRSTFPEDINHPEDDDRHDLFIPIGECFPSQKEEVI
jgi:hypothetical protein